MIRDIEAAINRPHQLREEMNSRDWLILIRAPGLGAARLHSLLETFPSAEAIVAASRRELLRRGLAEETVEAIASPDEARLEADLRWLDAPNRALLTWDSDGYPPQLRDSDRPPPALFVQGDPGVLWLPQIAVVGSRQATRGGLTNAREFAAAMARNGLVITSGLALGVDGVAHQAALDAGGYTVAVAATGLDIVYPARHRSLAEAISSQGALVSELPPGTEPRPGHFPARNRIIAGLSVGTLVVEAGVKSGSLITARQAMEQNRDVFAIPGSIHNPVARGCHRLIKDGAKLVETGQDVLDELGSAVRHQIEAGRGQLEQASDSAPPGPAEAGDPEYERLLEAMGFDPVGLDALVEETGLTVEAVSSMLLILELDGHIESQPGGKYCRIGEVAR